MYDVEHAVLHRGQDYTCVRVTTMWHNSNTNYDYTQQVDIERICIVKLASFSNSEINLSAPGWCPLIWVAYKCLLRILLRMRENFGLRGEFHEYPLTWVLIKDRGYRLYMMFFVFSSTYSWGQRLERLVTFLRFYQTILKQKQTGLLYINECFWRFIIWIAN